MEHTGAIPLGGVGGESPPGHSAGGMDRVTFLALYRQNVAPVYRYFYQQVGNPHDAEDLTATTFAKALASLSGYEEQGKFTAWLFGIARHTLGDFQRSRRQPVDLEVVAPTLVDAGPGPEEAALRAERAARLRRLLRRLPADQQEALILRFFGQLSTAEAATVLGRSEAAVKMLVHRAVAGLRDLYAREVQP